MRRASGVRPNPHVAKPVIHHGADVHGFTSRIRHVMLTAPCRDYGRGRAENTAKLVSEVMYETHGFTEVGIQRRNVVRACL